MNTEQWIMVYFNRDGMYTYCDWRFMSEDENTRKRLSCYIADVEFNEYRVYTGNSVTSFSSYAEASKHLTQVASDEISAYLQQRTIDVKEG